MRTSVPQGHPTAAQERTHLLAHFLFARTHRTPARLPAKGRTCRELSEDRIQISQTVHLMIDEPDSAASVQIKKTQSIRRPRLSLQALDLRAHAGSRTVPREPDVV